MAAPRAGQPAPWVDAVANAALPAIRQALRDAVTVADLPPDVLPSEAVAAASIALADGVLADQLAREQAVIAEVLRRKMSEDAPSSAHERLGGYLGVSRQTVEKRLRLTRGATPPNLPDVTALRAKWTQALLDQGEGMRNVVIDTADPHRSGER